MIRYDVCTKYAWNQMIAIVNKFELYKFTSNIVHQQFNVQWNFEKNKNIKNRKNVLTNHLYGDY